MNAPLRAALDPVPAEDTTTQARDWVRILARYREPRLGRSLWELGVSLVPFLGIWALAWVALSWSYWAGLALAVLNGMFLVRLFLVQHDCGHGGFLPGKRANDWVGRILGVLTVTPYAVWQKTHLIHHSGAGNLDQRGIGDIVTLTVREYRALSPLGKLQYRLYRNPVVIFGLGPTYIFLLQNRLPVGLMGEKRYWISAMGTNAVIAALLLAIWAIGGWAPILLVFLPTVLVAASIGMWLFFVQHQFEETHWDHQEDWQLHDAALHGSSHYVMPGILRWFTANIGIHHVHHLYSRIPFYRLGEVLRDHRELAEAQRLTIRESIACARLHLWDEASRTLLSFRDARKVPVAV